MTNNKIKATIKGITCSGEQFEETVKFELLPPEERKPHYGTGYYMSVKLPHDRKLVDVRYERTTDIEILADRWIQSYYGENAKEVIKVFPLEENLVPMPGIEGLVKLKQEYNR